MSDPKAGRDHNGQGFTCWLAGGGIKPGTVYGETDEVGHKARGERGDAERFPSHPAPPARLGPREVGLPSRWQGPTPDGRAAPPAW